MVDKLIPPRRGESLTVDSKGTTRFYEYLEKNAQSTNEIIDEVESPTNIIIDNSRITLAPQIQAELQPAEPLTWDETGFTWDSDKLSFDMTET